MANDTQSLNFKQVMRGYDKEEVESYIRDLNNSKNVSLKIYEQKVDELKEKLVLSNRERDALREKYASAKAEIDPIRQELNKAKEDLAEAKVALEKAQAGPSAIIGAATYSNYSARDDATYKTRINELTATVSQLSADLQIKEEKLSAIQKDYDLKDARIRDLEKTINDLNEKSGLYDDLYARNASLLREHETLVDRFNSLSANYQLTLDKRSNLEKQYQEAVGKYNLLSAEYESSIKDIQILDRKYKETLAKYDELCEEHNALLNNTESIRTSANHYGEIEDEIGSLRQAVEDYEKKLADAKAEKESLVKEIEIKASMVKTLANETEFHKQYASELEERVQALENMLNSGGISEYDMHSGAGSERCSALEAQIDEKNALISELREAKERVEQEYTEKITQMENDFSVTRSDLEDQIRKRDAKLKEFDSIAGLFVNKMNGMKTNE